MSIHPSLRGLDTLSGDRSVLTRLERIQKLVKDEKMVEGDSPYGLPKVRTKFKVRKAKVVEDTEGEEAEAAPADGEAAEAKAE